MKWLEGAAHELRSERSAYCVAKAETRVPLSANDDGLATLASRAKHLSKFSIGNRPLALFAGISIRLETFEKDKEVYISIELVNHDLKPVETLEKHVLLDDGVAHWRFWGKVLSLPLILLDKEGSAEILQARLGLVSIKKPASRRKLTLRNRRTRLRSRRRV
jgi:hypothetical protein